MLRGNKNSRNPGGRSLAKFDRYMLSQLLLFFGFFALVLVAVFWIGRAVRLFDQLIADGQSLIVFLEFSALMLPRVVLLVVPMAAFGAAVYVTNRLSNESELTVMQSTGSSPWRLARPVILFSLFLAVMVSLLSHVLVPVSLDRLSLRQNEINQDVTARLLTPGTFLHPSDGVTLYMRDISEDGVLQDVFISDRRDPNARVIYTAATAYLVRSETETTLFMVDGLAQRYSPTDQKLATGTYLDFAYDISSLVNDENAWDRKVRTVSTAELLGNWDAVSEQTGQSVGDIVEELHSRFALPIFTIATALFGFSAIFISGFSRFGSWRAVLGAFAVLLVLDSLRAALADIIRINPETWLLAYLPALIGLVLVLGLLALSAHPVRLRRRATT